MLAKGWLSRWGGRLPPWQRKGAACAVDTPSVGERAKMRASVGRELVRPQTRGSVCDRDHTEPSPPFVLSPTDEKLPPENATNSPWRHNFCSTACGTNDGPPKGLCSNDSGLPTPRAPWATCTPCKERVALPSHLDRRCTATEGSLQLNQPRGASLSRWPCLDRGRSQTASAPLYDGRHRVRGVISGDLPLTSPRQPRPFPPPTALPRRRFQLKQPRQRCFQP